MMQTRLINGEGEVLEQMIGVLPGQPTKNPPNLTGEWAKRLQSFLGYSQEQVSADEDAVRVYRDRDRHLPMAYIVPGASHSDKMDILEASRRDGFEFAVLGSPEEAAVYQQGAFEGEARRIGSLPVWAAGLRRQGLLSRDFTLPPFRAEQDIRAAFAAAHNAIYNEQANDPASTFDLLLLVITAKVLDEASPKGTYEFAEVEGEDLQSCSQRFGHLLDTAREWLDGIASEHVPARSSVSGSLAQTIFRVFQNHSLLLSSDSIAGTDVLGTAYESIVGSTFRGELGSYFTPRNIADFMVRLINVDHGKVFDLSCGSGGLLLAATRLSRAQNRESDGALDCFGNDINPRMVRTARLNFLMHSLDPRRVAQGDGLQLDRMFGEWFPSLRVGSGTWWQAIPNGPFDAVLANPPFAGHERAKESLSRTETAHRPNGAVRSLNRTLPFIEAIVASLRLGGVAGIVIPTSVLNAEEESFVRLRTALLEHVELMAIIGLPEKAFVHTDCGVHGALLFFRRVAHPREDYEIFVDWAQYLGYDRLGKYRHENDLPLIVERFHAGQWPTANVFRVSDLKRYGRWDPAWLAVARSMTDRPTGDVVPIAEVVEFRDARIPRRSIKEGSRYRFFEVSDADLDTGQVRTIHEVDGFELKKKGRIKNLLRDGDLLLPSHRDSLVAKSSPNGRSAVLAGPELDGVLTTDRFIVLRPLIQPQVAKLLLNSISVRRQIVAQCRGAASLDIRPHMLSSVVVEKRLLTESMLEELDARTQEVEELRAKLANAKERLEAEVDPPGAGVGPWRPAGLRQI